jgi:hypothetical protein
MKAVRQEYWGIWKDFILAGVGDCQSSRNERWAEGADHGGALSLGEHVDTPFSFLSTVLLRRHVLPIKASCVCVDSCPLFILSTGAGASPVIFSWYQKEGLLPPCSFMGKLYRLPSCS